MTGIPDIDVHKVYIGNEEPKDDRSLGYLNGDRPYEGTLAVAGPTYLGGHSGSGNGTVNIGTDIGEWSPKVPGRALDVEGDVAIEGNITQRGNKFQDGEHTSTENITTKAHFIGDITQTSGTPPGCKVFDLPHPNIEGYRLRHACVEGPEAAIYVRGRVSVDGIIELPDYWQNLVDKETITVQLTPIGCYQELFVERIDYGKTVRVKNSAGGTINAYYQVWANRAGEKLIAEYEGTSAADYPGDNSQYSIQGYHYDVRDQETKTKKKGRFDKK